VKGAAPNYNGKYITAIGATPTAPASGTNQFGISIARNYTNSSEVLYPYIAGAGYAYAADATTTSNLVYGPNGEYNEFFVRYMANISPSLPPGNYATVLTYVATAEY
jgi:hypothetical protein